MSEKVKIISKFKNLSYARTFPQVTVTAEANYFLQFNGYIIFLPSVTISPDALNIFEISVLKLLNIMPFTIEELSDKLCLKPDLIKFICARLIELKLLDDYEKVTDAGKNFLGQQFNNFTNKDLLPYCVLAARDTGKLFPRIFPRETWDIAKLDGTTIIQNDEVDGILKTQCISVPLTEELPSAIPQSYLREMTENFNRENRNKIFIEPQINIPSIYSEPVFLHIKTILQNKEDNFFLVSDGTEGHNEFLDSCIALNKKSILMKLKRRNARR